MFETSERPGKDRDIEGIRSDGELDRIAAYKIYVEPHISWGFDARDP
ncbi:MAG TPA: hypothetical protein VJ521_12670 [Acidobacteriota bacterium]|nr:hypothetical protein [Acidobacteriota bacterium]